jgi:hypothetical protein
MFIIHEARYQKSNHSDKENAAGNCIFRCHCWLLHFYPAAIAT